MTFTRSTALSVLAAGALSLALVAPPALAEEKAAPQEAAAPQTATPADPDTVVAVVNGSKITERDLSFAEIEIGQDLGNIPPESRRRVLVEYLIENQLFADAARSKQLSETDSFGERMEYLRRRALREEYFDTQIKTSVSEAAAKTFYNDQIKGMKPQEEVKARHILVETEDEARELLERFNRGDEFADLAKEASRDPGTKDNGGLLGFFSRGQMVPQFEEAAFALKAGEVSPPVQSRFGWHLIKVEERREKPLPQFDDVKDRILNSMILQTAQSVAEDLRNAAKVEYVDPEIKKQVAEQEKAQAAQQQAVIDQIKKLQDQQEKAGAAGGEAKPAEGEPAKPADAQ